MHRPGATSQSVKLYCLLHVFMEGSIYVYVYISFTYYIMLYIHVCSYIYIIYIYIYVYWYHMYVCTYIHKHMIYIYIYIYVYMYIYIYIHRCGDRPRGRIHGLRLYIHRCRDRPRGRTYAPHICASAFLTYLSRYAESMIPLSSCGRRRPPTMSGKTLVSWTSTALRGFKAL